MKSTILLAACLSWSAAYANLVFEAETVSEKAAFGAPTVTGTFVFKNSGTETIRIVSTRSSCGCTVPELPKDTIEPGEVGELKAVYKTSGRRGKQSSTITLETDQTPRTRYSLKLEVEIPSVTSIEPKLLRWDTRDDRSGKSAAIHIAPESGFKLSETVETPLGIDCTIEPDGTPGHYQVTFTPEKNAPTGLSHAKLSLLSNNGETLTERIYLVIR